MSILRLYNQVHNWQIVPEFDIFAAMKKLRSTYFEYNTLLSFLVRKDNLYLYVFSVQSKQINDLHTLITS